MKQTSSIIQAVFFHASTQNHSKALITSGHHKHQCCLEGLSLQSGPKNIQKPVTSRVTTSFKRGEIAPGTHLFYPIYKGFHNSIYNNHIVWEAHISWVWAHDPRRWLATRNKALKKSHLVTQPWTRNFADKMLLMLPG